MPDSRKLVSYECLNCGHAGSAKDVKRHAETTGCKDFRLTTLIISKNGKVIDEVVEILQL